MKTNSELKTIGLEALRSLQPTRSIGQHVFYELKEAILKGDIRPGSRLTENRIAAVVGISRTPVREAFHRLESEGLIRLIPQGGYVATGLTREEVEDIFGIRSRLESYAAGLAAKNHDEDDLRELEDKNRKAQECLDSNQLEKLPRINTEFHEILYNMSKRPKLIEVIRNFQAHTYRFRKIILSETKHAEKSIKTHIDLVNALRRRDIDRAENLVRKHILRGRQIVLKTLENSKEEF